jgi:hypothetical protein
MEDKLFLAWAAGFFDGEGCVIIELSSSPKSSRGQRTSLHATVTQTSIPCLQKYVDRFGGSIKTSQHTCPNSSRWAVQYTWSVRNEKAIKFLQEIQPYTVVKKEQIEVAVKYPLTSMDGKKYGSSKNPIPDDVWDTRLALRLELQNIRAKMKTPATPRVSTYG